VAEFGGRDLVGSVFVKFKGMNLGKILYQGNDHFGNFVDSQVSSLVDKFETNGCFPVLGRSFP